MSVCVFLMVLVLKYLLSEGSASVRIPAMTFKRNDACSSQEFLDDVHQNFKDIVTYLSLSLNSSFGSSISPSSSATPSPTPSPSPTPVSPTPEVMTYECGGTQGWRRVGYLDMTDPTQSCPPGLALKYYSPGLRSCGRATNDSAGCWSTFYDTGGSLYNEVCGRVRGYQFGDTGAFITRNRGIDSYYIEGVSLTHGPSGSRTHIWSFAAELDEANYDFNIAFRCRCTIPNGNLPPSFVGEDYFCESGLHTRFGFHRIFYPNDPLWDGRDCISSCCDFNNPPYFTKTLLTSTSNDIELRICSRQADAFNDIPIDQVELYVR